MRHKKYAVIFFVLCLSFLQFNNASASIIKSDLNSQGMRVYYVSNYEENMLALSIIKANRYENVKIIYSSKMRLSMDDYKKEVFNQIYYPIDKLKCASYGIGLCNGFLITKISYYKNRTTSVQYRFFYAETKDQSNYVDNVINTDIKNNINNLHSDYQKAYWAYQWVIDHVHYDETLTYDSGYLGLTNLGTVCKGYASLYSNIADKLGLECRYIEGSVFNSKYNNHAWNILKINGKWYCIDTTFGDYYNSNDYFLVSVNSLMNDNFSYHKSMAYDSYAKHGEIFSETNYDKLESVDNNNTISPSVYRVNMDVLRVNYLKIGEKYNYMISNKDNINMEFTSTNENIVAVDSNGLITAIGIGTATVSAYNIGLNIRQDILISVSK
ncbi:transglutaminase domain-containing protein [Anaeromicropila herbilytica]|uniref:Transglutaminase-like domain-containing protein n=1 Tax=Anaeromicropila herbilytica TaxID=2785025 RepID=A0A7R7EKK2_9FIRM|nr:transglutaminase domain-containing protein [Anaeromicropila herbilytica]BCN30410.1 hypothetical protein bsdtb5_17050 [Anaeromicropila herbilytica]